MHAIDAKGRARLALWLVAAGFLAAFALAPGLWLVRPPFTPLPVADALALPAPLEAVVLWALGGSLLVIALLPRPRAGLVAWMAVFALRAVWDVALWQPYFLEYLGVLAALVLGSRVLEGDDERVERSLALARLVVVAAYLWPGIAKIDRGFITHVAPAVLDPVFSAIGVSAPRWFGAIIPVTEIAVAVLLLVPRLRWVGIAAAIVTHVTILWSIGPIGLSVQQIVWPWNLVLPGLVIVLFGVAPSKPWRETLRWRDPLLLGVVVVFFVVPALSYVVPIEPYPALRVYSTKIHEGFLTMPDAAVGALPEPARSAFVKKGTRHGHAITVRIADWSAETLGGYLSPSRRTHITIARRACALANDDDDIVLVLVDPPDWRTAELTTHRMTCDELR